MQNPKGQAINARFFEAVNALIQTKDINSFNEFCTLYKVDRRNMERLQKEPHREFPMFLLTSLVMDFKISPDWLLTGRGKMK